MSSSVSLSHTADPQAILTEYARNPEKLALVVQALGDGPEVAILAAQLKVLSVANDSENPLIRQQKLQLVQKVVNTAIIIRQHRTLQSEMALITLQSKQVVAETRARILEDQMHLQQEQAVHDQTIDGTLTGIDRTNQATVEIVQSRIEMQQQDIARVEKNLNKAKQDIRDQKEQEQALLARSRNLSAALGNN